MELVFWGAWGQPTNTCGRSETVGIYLVIHPSFPSMDTDKALKDLEIAERPILSDNDFVEWNVTNNTIVIPPNAAVRFETARRC